MNRRNPFNLGRFSLSISAYLNSCFYESKNNQLPLNLHDKDNIVISTRKLILLATDRRHQVPYFTHCVLLLYKDGVQRTVVLVKWHEWKTAWGQKDERLLTASLNCEFLFQIYLFSLPTFQLNITCHAKNHYVCPTTAFSNPSYCLSKPPLSAFAAVCYSYTAKLLQRDF